MAHNQPVCQPLFRSLLFPLDGNEEPVITDVSPPLTALLLPSRSIACLCIVVMHDWVNDRFNGHKIHRHRRGMVLCLLLCYHCIALTVLRDRLALALSPVELGLGVNRRS